MLPQQIGAKAVHGTDIGAGNQHLLSLEVHVCGIFRDSFGQGRGEALLHFSGSRLGEGDH